MSDFVLFLWPQDRYYWHDVFCKRPNYKFSVPFSEKWISERGFITGKGNKQKPFNLGCVLDWPSNNPYLATTFFQENDDFLSFPFVYFSTQMEKICHMQFILTDFWRRRFIISCIPVQFSKVMIDFKWLLVHVLLHCPVWSILQLWHRSLCFMCWFFFQQQY